MEKKKNVGKYEKRLNFFNILCENISFAFLEGNYCKVITEVSMGQKRSNIFLTVKLFKVFLTCC